MSLHSGYLVSTSKHGELREPYYCSFSDLGEVAYEGLDINRNGCLDPGTVHKVSRQINKFYENSVVS